MHNFHDMTVHYDKQDHQLNETLNFVIENLTYAEMLSEETAVPCRATKGRFAYCYSGLKQGKFGYGDGTQWLWQGEIAALNASIYKAEPARVKSTGDIQTLYGLPIIDSIQLVDGDSILLNDQANPASNGVWVVHTGAWIRRDDCNTWSELVSAMVVVSEGNTFKDTQWMCTIDENSGVLETNAVTWINIPLINDIIARDALTRVGNFLDVNPDKRNYTTLVYKNGVYNDLIVNIAPMGAIGTVDTETGAEDHLGLRVRPDNTTIRINSENKLETIHRLVCYRKTLDDESIRLFSTNVDNGSYIGILIQDKKRIVIPHNMGLVPYSLEFRTVDSGSERGNSIYPNVINVTDTTVTVSFTIHNVQHNSGTPNYNQLVSSKVEVFMIGGI